MKLLFDHNLSHKLVARLADALPDSTQTKLLGLNTAPDSTIWEFASKNGFTIVTLDRDFADLAVLKGAPPKIIWLRCGNSTVNEVERLLRANLASIQLFLSDSHSDLLEIWP